MNDLITKSNNFTRLSELSKEQEDRYMNYYNNVLLTGLIGFKVLEPFEDFNESGLRFPIEYLKEIDKYVIFLPIEIMANYVDAITKSEIDKDNYSIPSLMQELEGFDIEKDYDNINATSIGNLAYIALEHKNILTSNKATEILNQIFVKCKGIFLELLNDIL